MKAFIISAILFVILICMIVTSSLYVRSVSERIVALTLAIDLSGNDTRPLDELENYWQNRRSILDVAISRRELDRITETIVSLRASYVAKNMSDVRLYRELLLNCAKELSERERISLLLAF